METTTASQFVHIVDDDQDIRASLKWLLESVGLSVKTFANAQAFFDYLTPLSRGCILMDVRMPGISGLSAQVSLNEDHVSLPIIMISGHADVEMAVTAMSKGALTFLQKPFNDQVLIDCVQDALKQENDRWELTQQVKSFREKVAGLTRREKQVFACIVDGLSNQETADNLGINRKTVEGHRGHLMSKLDAGSVADLVKVHYLVHNS